MPVPVSAFPVERAYCQNPRRPCGWRCLFRAGRFSWRALCRIAGRDTAQGDSCPGLPLAVHAAMAYGQQMLFVLTLGARGIIVPERKRSIAACAGPLMALSLFLVQPCVAPRLMEALIVPCANPLRFSVPVPYVLLRSNTTETGCKGRQADCRSVSW